MKETKTVQVYPDDAIVNATIEEYGSFGWEVISNQLFQEFTGQTSDGTRHYSSYNKITFTREKDAAWYDRVKGLENEYFVKKDMIENYKRCKPVLQPTGPQGSIGVLLGVYLYMMLIIPGIIYSVVRGVKKSKRKKKYKKELAEYESVYPARIKEAEKELSELRARAEKLVTGKE